jgi:hypothetical protein
MADRCVPNGELLFLKKCFYKKVIRFYVNVEKNFFYLNQFTPFKKFKTRLNRC